MIISSEECLHLLCSVESGFRQGAGKKCANEAIIAGDIKNTHNLAGEWVPDRRCRTSQILPSITIVFGSHQLHAMSICQRSTDSVCAGRCFTPIAAWNKVDTRQAVANGGISNDIEQAAFGIA